MLQGGSPWIWSLLVESRCAAFSIDGGKFAAGVYIDLIYMPSVVIYIFGKNMSQCPTGNGELAKSKFW